MNAMELREILEQHRLWLNGKGGKRADLSHAGLSHVDLSYTDLSFADLSYSDLSYANLSYANMRYTNMCYTSLVFADMSYVSLHYADMWGASLYGAKLDNVTHNGATRFFTLQCPEEGSFIGYKKASGHIVELEILPDAKRSSATTRKCRCSAARVLSITTLDGKEDGTQFVSSNRDPSFVYRVGEIVRVDDFDEDRWNECSTGIHFFVTRDEAVNYK